MKLRNWQKVESNARMRFCTILNKFHVQSISPFYSIPFIWILRYVTTSNDRFFLVFRVSSDLYENLSLKRSTYIWLF